MGMGEKIVGQTFGVPQGFSQFLEIKRAHEGHPGFKEDGRLTPQKKGRKSRIPQSIKLTGYFPRAFLNHSFPPVNKVWNITPFPAFPRKHG
jgi:hypothetical protein